MPTKRFQLTAAKLVDGDPFGLHDPITLDDLERIDQALADGTVEGAEETRIAAIRDEANELWDRSLARLQDQLVDKVDASVTDRSARPD